MTTTTSNNSAPQWAIDAAREYYNGLAYGTQQSEGFLSLNAPKLAAIIARHAPQSPYWNGHPDAALQAIADRDAEIARLREATRQLVILVEAARTSPDMWRLPDAFRLNVIAALRIAREALWLTERD